MFTLRDTYDKIVKYGEEKRKLSVFKTFLLGVMAGFFVGIGYIGYYFLADKLGGDSKALAMASTMFPVGLIMIVFLGGSLFTSDSLSFFGFLNKKAKLNALLLRWGIVLLGNFIGAFVVAGLASAAFGNLFNHHVKDHTMFETLEHFIAKKQGDVESSTSWSIAYSARAFASAILCNVLVAGTIWMTKGTNSAIGTFMLIFLPITLFAVVGFEHIVANMVVFWMGILNPNTGINVGKMVVLNFIPVALGNWLGGAIVLPMVYYLIYRMDDKQKQNLMKHIDDGEDTIIDKQIEQKGTEIKEQLLVQEKQSKIIESKKMALSKKKTELSPKPKPKAKAKK